MDAFPVFGLARPPSIDHHKQVSGRADELHCRLIARLCEVRVVGSGRATWAISGKRTRLGRFVLCQSSVCYLVTAHRDVIVYGGWLLRGTKEGF